MKESSIRNRREFLKAGLVTFATSMTHGCHLMKKTRKPNMVILFIDDLGYGDIGCFGNKRIPTPNIDSMADNGVKCTMSYITNPPCSPSRSCLMTGMYAQRFGKSGMARGLPIPHDHPTLAEFMRDSGYVTGQIGKWDIGSEKQGPHQRGFMQVAKRAPGTHYICKKNDGTEIYRTDLDGDNMVEFIERNRDKSFFLYFSPFAIHSPLKETPQHYRDRIKGGGTVYEGAVAAVDDAVGKLLTVLKKYNLEKNTLILLTGDNGPNITLGGSAAPYRGGKFSGNTQYEGWVHTPTIAYWPGILPKAKIFEGLMCTIDFYMTAVALSGGAAPKRCEGRNLLPYLKGEKSGDVHEYLFWHNDDPTDKKHRNLHAVRWENWRLVKYPDGWHLFNLKKDPQETSNLAEKYPKIVENMNKKYDAFVATLPPIKPSINFVQPDNQPKGWGWVMDNEA